MLNFRSVGPTVQPAERKQTNTQTHIQGDTWTLPKILPLPLKREVIKVNQTYQNTQRSPLGVKIPISIQLNTIQGYLLPDRAVLKSEIT